MNFLIITPTYNENANISTLISKIRDIDIKINLDVLIIDDGSPDGTASTIKQLMLNDSRLHLIERKKKNGLASAYCDGFK